MGEGNARLLSFKNLPDPSIIFTPRATESSSDCMKEIHFSKQSSGTMVSGFKKRIYSPEASSQRFIICFGKTLILCIPYKMLPLEIYPGKNLYCHRLSYYQPQKSLLQYFPWPSTPTTGNAQENILHYNLL